MTLHIFSEVLIHMMNNRAKCHWNSFSKYKDITSHEISVCRQLTNYKWTSICSQRSSCDLWPWKSFHQLAWLLWLSLKSLYYVRRYQVTQNTW